MTPDGPERAADAPPVDESGAEGLYSLHVRLGDGRDGKGSGVLVLRDGVLLGGDAYLFYVGTYRLRGATLIGAVTINQHTPSPDATPLFGGREVGIGFSGPFDGQSATLDGTALVGRESMLFRATLRKVATTGGDGLTRPRGETTAGL